MKKNSLVPNGDNKFDNLKVYKTLPILSLVERSGLDSDDLSLIDFSMSLIDFNAPDNPEYYEISFTKRAYEEYCGVSKINASVLKERIKKIQSPLMIFDPIEPSDNRYLSVSLYEIITYDNGLITMRFTPTGRKYFFNEKSYQFFKFKLQYLRRLRPHNNSYVLYAYLMKNEFRCSWFVDVDSLRKVFNCPTKEFRRFREEILDAAVKDINSLTDLSCSIEYKYDSRSCNGVVFTVNNKNNVLSSVSSLSDDNSEELDFFDSDIIRYYRENGANLLVSDADILSLDKLLQFYLNYDDEHFPRVEERFSVYLALQSKAEMQNEKRKIKNFSSYMRTIITNEFTDLSERKKLIGKNNNEE